MLVVSFAKEEERDTNFLGL